MLAERQTSTGVLKGGILKLQSIKEAFGFGGIVYTQTLLSNREKKRSMAKNRRSFATGHRRQGEGEEKLDCIRSE